MPNNNRKPFVNREGRGGLFKSNDTHPKAPGHRGRCTVGGVVYLISAWVETSQSGGKYLNLKFDRAPDDEQLQGHDAPAPGQRVDPDRDQGALRY